MANIDLTERFIELRAKQYSFREIARKLKKSLPTLVEWDHKFHDRINKCQAEELKSLIEEYHLTIHARMESFAKSLSDLRAELSKRDISTLSVEQIYRLTILYDDKVDKLLHASEAAEPEKEIGLKTLLDAFNRPANTITPETSPDENVSYTLSDAQKVVFEDAIKKAIDMGVATDRPGAIKDISEFYIKYAVLPPAEP
jgi:antitoxin component HigA of HigAB toxin-antitoxin module